MRFCICEGQRCVGRSLLRGLKCLWSPFEAVTFPVLSASRGTGISPINWEEAPLSGSDSQQPHPAGAWLDSGSKVTPNSEHRDLLHLTSQTLQKSKLGNERAQVEILSLCKIIFIYRETTFCQCHLRFMGLYYDHPGTDRQCLLPDIAVCCGFSKHGATYRFIYSFFSVIISKPPILQLQRAKCC